MTKTNKMATIGQLNRQTRKYSYIDRRVYEHNGKSFVKNNGSMTSITWLALNGRTVNIWF